jgi:Ca2+-binding EF-hand superfamily protein
MASRPKQGSLSYNVTHYLAWLIEEELQFVRKVEQCRGEIGELEDYELSKCFVAIAGKLGLTRYNMHLFLSHYSCSLTEDAIDALFNRWDLDRDCMLSYSEFVAATKPRTSLASEPQISFNPSSSRHSSPLKTSMTASKFSTPDRKISQAREANTGSTAHSNTESPYLKSPPKTASASSRKLDFESCTPATETQQVISALFQDIDIDAKLDYEITQLAFQRDFSLEDLYLFFNRLGDDGLTILDFEATAQELGVKVDRQVIIQLMQKYDADGDGRLKDTDLYAMFSPKDPFYKKVLARRCSSSSFSQFSYMTLSYIAASLRMHFECVAKAERLRQAVKREKIDLYSVFNALDLDRDGYLSLSDLSESLRTHRVVIQRDLELLTVRFDSRHYGRISYADFVKELTPKSH